VGMGGLDRVELVRSNAEIFKRVMVENDVDYKDDYFEFTDVTIEPKPIGGKVPFWYCGATPRSARLAVEFCDGWMPGRISMATLAKRIADNEKLAADQGKQRPTIAVIPPTSEEATREEALEHVNIPGLLAWANKATFAVKPESGSFETVEDLEGQLIVGSPEEAVAECRKFEALGVEHLVFDFRFKFDKWFDQIELLGSEVLPRLRD
jgi:alkanesulfonate monooxygenase SsuD/methylene tetrahydromethanopterin reductase-like flavin-dependent oxidoreductase (luciferase family)